MNDQPEPEEFHERDSDLMLPVEWEDRHEGPLEDPRYRMRRQSLQFYDDDVEKRFLEGYGRSTLRFRRIGVVIGIAAFAIFGLIDLVNSPDAWRVLWAVRFFLAVPILLLVLLASYWEKAEPYLGYLVSGGLIVSSLALVTLIHLSTRAAMPQHFEALLVLLPSAFAFLRLRVLETTVTSAIVIIGFMVESLLLRPLPPVQLAYMFGLLLAASVVGIGLAFMMESQARNAFVLNAGLAEASIRDPLTGLYNRRWLDVILAQLTSAFQRYGFPFSLILIDLDGFKAVNDTMGYTQGDSLLRLFSAALTARLRKADIIFRYGGDEFVILAPATQGPAATIFIDRLRDHIQSLSLREYDPSKPISFSAGVAVVDKIDESALGLFQRANRALRAAKEAGGGLTVLEEAGKVEPETQEA